MPATTCPRCGTVDPLARGACWACPGLTDAEAAALARAPSAVRPVTLKAIGETSTLLEVAQHLAVRARLEEAHRKADQAEKRPGPGRRRGQPAGWLSWLAGVLAGAPEGTSAPAVRAAAEAVGLDRPADDVNPLGPNQKTAEELRLARYRQAVTQARKDGRRIL